MNMITRPARRDSGTVLILVCLLIFLVTAFTVSLADESLKTQVRTAETGAVLKEVYSGIVGNPDQGTFGYLGDTGNYPANLVDLAKDPGVTGWSGPYISNVRIANGMLYDSYGSPLEYFTALANGVLDQITVIGDGLDRSSTNTAANPNVSGQFAGTLPSNAGYPAANPDNNVFPDFYTDINSLSRENVGTLAYTIQNFDQNALGNAMVPGCPGLYNIRKMKIEG